MNAKELRSQDAFTLNETLMTLLRDHFELRMKHKSAQLEDASKLNKIKKSIARVKTIIREKRV
jgi:large subunit ribosomal protein L29